MPRNPSRFVVVDGVQYSKARAYAAGLIDAEGNVISTVDRHPSRPAGLDAPPTDTTALTSPPKNRARGSKASSTKADVAEDQGDAEESPAAE